MKEINEKKMQIVIDNYFKLECDVNTSIRSAYEKGFRTGVRKGLAVRPRLEQEMWTPEPKRKTGKWIEVHGFCTPGGDPVWACSECGKGVHVYGIEHGTYGADVSDGQWKACPNCGAMMLKEGDEHD